MAIEYADPAELGWDKGNSANNWQPGEWTNAPPDAGEEYQPDLDPPRIPDYANLRKHKHYRQYFRPHKHRPFPAWIYNHKTRESKIVKSKEEVIEHGPDWSPVPFDTGHNMVGKSLPVKSHAEQMNENIRLLVAQGGGKPPVAIDPTAVASIVAAVMQAMNGQTTSALAAKPADGDKVDGRPELELPAVLDRRPKK